MTGTAPVYTPEQVAEANPQFSAWYIRELCRHASGRCHGKCVPNTRARSLDHVRGSSDRIFLTDDNVQALLAMHAVTASQAAAS